MLDIGTVRARRNNARFRRTKGRLEHLPRDGALDDQAAVIQYRSVSSSPHNGVLQTMQAGKQTLAEAVVGAR